MAEKPAAATADKGVAIAKKMNPKVVMLIKNQFWIIGGIAVVTAVVVWYLGVDALVAQFNKDKKTNDDQFAAVKRLSLMSGPNALPSETYTVKVNELKKTLNGQVVDAWRNLYKRQVEVLRVHKNVDLFRELILMEPDDRKALLEADPPLGAKVAAALQVYHNNQVLEEDFAELFKTLNLRHPKSIDDFGKAIPGVAADEKGIEGILVWKAPFTPKALRDRYRTVQAPSIDRVAVTYEDIWTFRSLFSALQAINSKPIEVWLDVLKGKPAADTPVDQANVPIKRIDYCDIAQSAMVLTFDDPGDVRIVAAGTSAGSPDTASPPPSSSGNSTSAFAPGNQGTDEETLTLLKGRYIDGRNAQVEDPSNPPFAEFRQMYVQVKVLMDQRLVPVLITEFANAPLPIEMRQVRVSLLTVDDIRKQGAIAVDATSVQQSPHDALVTVRGVVYIYTKPDEPGVGDDKAKLGKGSDPAPSKREYGIPKRAVIEIIP
ncbi:MAG: hypothetical protein K8U03_22035 [Planctomycetia bacterium]|nr:hypothetical protein [Planctomycetia bacterium]